MTKGLPAGSEVIARRDFQGTSPEHLSFYKGDILTIVDENDDDNAEWYQAEDSENKRGLVPLSHLQRRTEVALNQMPWFHGKITREEAERLLQPPKVGISHLSVFILFRLSKKDFILTGLLHPTIKS